ncbi:MAG: hypothetical protein IPJ41_04540 [Phycisphaerales bacterium]|nr:hypothetical protein [Phycisphaerales bacterium]
MGITEGLAGLDEGCAWAAVGRAVSLVAKLVIAGVTGLLLATAAFVP